MNDTPRIRTVLSCTLLAAAVTAAIEANVVVITPPILLELRRSARSAAELSVHQPREIAGQRERLAAQALHAGLVEGQLDARLAVLFDRPQHDLEPDGFLWATPD